MGLAAASAAGILTRPAFGDAHPFTAAPFSPSAPLADPDLLVVNAKVYTMDAAMPRAEAFAVSGGRIIAVGNSADVRGLARKGSQTFDAKGMTIVPGFTDCHNHAGGTTLLYEVLVGNPFEVEFVTIDSIVQKLRAKAQQTPAGMWVDGYFFDDTKVKDKRQLVARDLDQCRPSIRSSCTTAAGTRRSTTPRRSNSLRSTRAPRTRRAARSTGTRAAS
jgi:hypothetical protein